jgi:hypothetical protein
MRKPNFGKPRSISGAISSLAGKLPKLNVPRSATPSPPRPHPKVGKPEGRRK